MSLTASARSVPGTLRQQVTVRGRYHLVTDEPPSVGGDDLGPAPHELLPAALAACIGTTLSLYARAKHWELGEIAVDVDYDHHAGPRHFEIVIHCDADLSPNQLERLEKVAAACPLDARSRPASPSTSESSLRFLPRPRRRGGARASPSGRAGP